MLSHPNDILLTFLASDHSSDGLHHLTTYGLLNFNLAGNRFDGYFATALKGQAMDDSSEPFRSSNFRQHGCD